MSKFLEEIRIALKERKYKASAVKRVYIPKREIKKNMEDGLHAIYDADLKGYFDTIPHDKLLLCVMKRIVDKSFKKKCFKPIPEMIKELNENLRGWENYFGKVGHPRKEFRKINSYTIMKLTKHLKRRSQRPYKPPKGFLSTLLCFSGFILLTA